MKYLFVFSLLFLSFLSISQTQRQWKKYGDLSFSEKDFQGASDYYHRAYLKDTTDLEVLALYCQSLRLARNYTHAEQFYRLLLAKDESGKNMETMYWLGVLNKFNGNYEEAIKHFNSFLDLRGNSYYLKQKALHEIEGCKLALNNPPDQWHLMNPGENLNSPYAEFAPVLLSDSTMIFSSQRMEEVSEESGTREFRVQLYEAEKHKGKWITREALSEKLNDAGYHVCNGSFSIDKRYFYFSVCDKTFSCQIAASKFSNGVWSEPVFLGKEINLPGYNTTQPSISQMGGREVLLFTSDRPGGKGGLDIWYSLKKNDFNFSAPLNLGEGINSLDDDISPWYDASDSTLYFSSLWWPGYGGYDVFKSKGILKNQDAPENLGPKVNSPRNDLYFSIVPNGEIAYLTSNRQGSLEEKGIYFNDLWELEWVRKKDVPKIVVADKRVESINEARAMLPISLYFHNDQPGASLSDTTAPFGYDTYYRDYESLQDIYLKEASVLDQNKSSESIALFFDNDLKEGFNYLLNFSALVLERLKAGDKMVLGIQAYTSPLGDLDYNIKLSKRRLSSLEIFFKKYKAGALKPYIENGALKLVWLPFESGDFTKNMKDKSLIYSREAALSRRIEITAISLEEE